MMTLTHENGPGYKGISMPTAGAGTIPNKSITLEKYADFNANSILGRNENSAGTPVYLTPAQLLLMLPIATTSLSGLLSAADKAKLDTAPADIGAAIEGAGGTTDLSYTASATNGIVASSTGNDATLPLVTTTNAGLMSPSDKTKLDTAPADIQAAIDAAGGGGGGATNLSYTASPTNGIVASDTGNDATLPLSDGTNAGLMAPAQHTKLAGIATAATANSSDADLLNRANHTGTQAASTISDFNSAADSRADARINASDKIGSDISSLTGATQVTNHVIITQAGYDAIGTPDANTVYEIVG